MGKTVDDKERLPSDERVLLADVAVLEALLQEYADEHGPDFSQKALLGEASLPQNLLGQLREARRDLAILRQNSYCHESRTHLSLGRNAPNPRRFAFCPLSTSRVSMPRVATPALARERHGSVRRTVSLSLRIASAWR